MPAPGWWRSLPGGKRVSALGFGCSSLWAKPGFGDAAAAEVLEAAWAGEINHFDTAPSYGAGTGERRLGAWLRGRDPAAVVVSTKVGSNLIDGQVVRGFDRDTIARSFDGSLARLGLDRVDVLYLHGPQPAELDDGLFRFLEEQKSAGRIGLAGLESGAAATFEHMVGTPIDVAMLHYNVGDPSTGPLIERLAAAGKTIVSGTALAQGKFGMRTFVPTSRAKLWYLLRMLKNDPLFAFGMPGLARRLRRADRSPHAAAIRFVTGHPHITSSLFGSSNALHVRSNAAAGHRPLGRDDRRRLGG